MTRKRSYNRTDENGGRLSPHGRRYYGSGKPKYPPANTKHVPEDVKKVPENGVSVDNQKGTLEEKTEDSTGTSPSTKEQETPLQALQKEAKPYGVPPELIQGMLDKDMIVVIETKDGYRFLLDGDRAKEYDQQLLKIKEQYGLPDSGPYTGLEGLPVKARLVLFLAEKFV